jgi:hypothetical protein
MTHQLFGFDPPSKLFFMGVTIIKKQSRGTGEVKTYKRFRPKDQTEAIAKLPGPITFPSF